MKYLIFFENFETKRIGGLAANFGIWKNFIKKQIKQFPVVTEPKLPFKRELTANESNIMRKYFIYDFSWTNGIDQNGNIILGRGEDSGGIYYLTEDFFEKLNEYLKNPELYNTLNKFNL